MACRLLTKVLANIIVENKVPNPGTQDLFYDGKYSSVGSKFVGIPKIKNCTTKLGCPLCLMPVMNALISANTLYG